MQETLARFVPIASSPWDRAKAAHLLNRAGFGGRPDEIDRVSRLGMDAAVDELLDYDRIAENVAPPDFASLRTLWDTVARLRQQNAPQRQRFEALVIAQRGDNQKLQEVREWWVTRMIQTRRPLQERMVLFWHGHLVSGRPDARLAENLFAQNELFRRMALGNFKELIVAISKDPAMLEYLDNESNRRGRPNENYARELLELFTMGIGNYTEQDIKEAARAFTGWTRRAYDFYFDARQHDDGPKTFLGRTGNLDGGDIVNTIFEHPATARFLPRRLFEFFAYLRPDESLVEELADLFRRSRFTVAPLMRTILTSQVFYSERAMRSQVKSPAQLVVGTARLLDVATSSQQLRAMDLMGQALFYPPNVGGWPRGESWITTATLFFRYNYSNLLLVGGRMPGVAGRPSAQPPLPPGVTKALDGARTAGDAVDRLVEVLMAGALDDQRKLALVKALGASSAQQAFATTGGDADVRLRSTLHLLMSSPEYQVC